MPWRIRVLRDRLQEENRECFTVSAAGSTAMFTSRRWRRRNFLDLDVALEEIQLLAQRDFVGAVSGRAGIAQERAEARDQRDRSIVLLFAHEHRDGVHGVEQKVRAKLFTQGLGLEISIEHGLQVGRCRSSSVLLLFGSISKL